MASNYQIKADEIEEGKIILVQGKLGFARLTRLIEGKQLAASDARRQQNGMNPVNAPHTTATITQASVLFADQAAATKEEMFIHERLFVSKKNPGNGQCYSIDSKGTNLPIIAIPNGEGQLEQDLTGQELASGLNVTLVLRTYKSPKFSQRGIALEQVIVNEPVRYYSGGGVATNELAARGIVFATPPQRRSADQAQGVGDAAPIAPADGADMQNTYIDQSGFPMPAPASAAPAPVAVAQPVAQAAPVAPVAAAPAAPVAVAPAAPVAVAPAAPVAPVAAAQPAPAAPAGQTQEQQIALLQAQLAAAQNGGSAVGAPTAGSPWSTNDAAQPGITYQGQGK